MSAIPEPAGAEAPRRSRPQGGEAGAAALPCLNSNNSNEPSLPPALVAKLNQLSTSHRKTAFALAYNVAHLCATFGINRIGFLTLTFADHVTCAKEAGRRFNSLRTGVLAARYEEWICVIERMKSGRLHFHLLVVMAGDVRTGFDFAQAASRVYSSANAVLRAEWASWRKTNALYGFGRSELLPVKSNEAGLSKYVGKYIAKHIEARELRDKGVRLVRYSRGSNPHGTRFMFLSPRSRLWRWQVGEFARRNGIAQDDFEAMSARFGPKWGFHRRSEIMEIEPPSLVVAVRAITGEDDEWLTLWDVWQADRYARADLVARWTGCTQANAYFHLFQPTLFH